jgi:hypothetical protein
MLKIKSRLLTAVVCFSLCATNVLATSPEKTFECDAAAQSCHISPATQPANTNLTATCPSVHNASVLDEVDFINGVTFLGAAGGFVTYGLTKFGRSMVANTLNAMKTLRVGKVARVVGG